MRDVPIDYRDKAKAIRYQPDDDQQSTEPAPVVSFTSPLEEGMELRDRGVALVDSAVSVAWRDRADVAIAGFIREMRDFTADDVTAVAGMPSHPNAVGARISSWARSGSIRRVDSRRGAARPQQHARLITVWRPMQ